MPTKRKTTTMLLTISYPAKTFMDRPITAAMARREVRTLITHQANWLDDLDTKDIKVRKITPAKP